jgi:hypothetical protein
MKMTSATLAACLLIGFLVTTVRAAETVEANGPKTAQRIAAPPPATFNFTFPGGSLEQLLRAIETASGEKLNLVAPPNFYDKAGKSAVAPMDLREVSVQDLLMALNYTQRQPTGVLFEFRYAKPIWTVGVVSRPDPRESRVFYVGNLLTHYKIEDVTTAIKTVWALKDTDPKPELKYHQDTKLLIVFAKTDQIDEVSNIVNELKASVAPALAPSGGKLETPSLAPPAPESGASKKSKF